MKFRSGMKFTALLLVFTAILLAAGCTQPAGVITGTPTATPTPAATHPPAPATPAAVATPNATSAVPVVNQTLRTELAALAKTFAGQTDGKALTAALQEGPNSTAFKTVFAQLKAFKATDSRIVFVYTLEQQNGTVRFIVDADYGMPNGSSYLYPYQDAPAELKKPVTGPIAVGPYTDQWGTFYSGFAPVNASTNATLVVGVDVRA